MSTAKLLALKSYVPGTQAVRKAKFNRMLEQARKYKAEFLDQELMAAIVLNFCTAIKDSDFVVKLERMVDLLQVFGGYTPSPSETLRTASLKVSNKLCETLTEEFFAAVLERAIQINVRVITSRKVAEPEIDLDDEDDVPLATDTTFSSHKSALLDDKDGLRSHLSLGDRINALATERSLIREWGDKAQQNLNVAAKVVFAYAKKDVASLPAAKVQQYLLKCFSHRIRALTSQQPEVLTPVPQQHVAEELRSPEKRTRENVAERAVTPPESDEPTYQPFLRDPAATTSEKWLRQRPSLR